MTPPDTTSSDAFTECFSAVEDALRKCAVAEGIPGATVAVLVGDKWGTACYGVDDLDTKRPRDEFSRQHTTCMNKMLIAYVTMMIVDRGLVGLDEPLTALLPEAMRRRGGQVVEVTLRHLLSHSSGIDESFENWAFDDAVDVERQALRFERYPQFAEPGEVFAFSDAGIVIAALLIERVLGQPWRRAVNEMLLEPLGIKSLPINVDTTRYYDGTVASGHVWDEQSARFRPVPPEGRPMAVDILGEHTTCFNVAEIATLVEFALDDGVTRQGQRLLSAELARQMRSIQIAVPRHNFYHAWGLGWHFCDEESFGFNGKWHGQDTYVVAFPARRTALVLLVNADPSLVMYYDVLRALKGNDQPWLDRPVPSVDPAGCVGTYAADGYRLVIEPGVKNLRYQFFERVSELEWGVPESGELRPSGFGGFSGHHGGKQLRASISPVSLEGNGKPKFFRFAGRVLRRTD